MTQPKKWTQASRKPRTHDKVAAELLKVLEDLDTKIQSEIKGVKGRTFILGVVEYDMCDGREHKNEEATACGGYYNENYTADKKSLQNTLQGIASGMLTVSQPEMLKWTDTILKQTAGIYVGQQHALGGKAYIALKDKNISEIAQKFKEDLVSNGLVANYNPLTKAKSSRAAA